MSGKAEHEEASRSFNKLVTVKDASRLAGVHRGIGQLYTQHGIIVPTQSVGKGEGWNRYGIIEIVELAVAKRLAEAGVPPEELTEQFWVIRNARAWEGADDLPNPQPSTPLRLRLFDPFPDVQGWYDAMGKPILHGKNQIQVPGELSEWPLWWRGVKDILPFALGMMISESHLFLPPYGDLHPKDQSIADVYTRAKGEMLNDLHLGNMGERTNVVFLDLAMIKARVGQAIIDDGWFDNEAGSQ